MQPNKQKLRLKCFQALWYVKNKAIPTVPPEGQTEKWKALQLGVKAAMCHLRTTNP
jgi:hypothetical protein